MRFKYVLFHILIHFLLIGALTLFLGINMFNFFIIFSSSWILDLDHLSLLKKKGVKGYLILRSDTEFGKPRNYFLHNFVMLSVAILGSTLVLVPQFLILGVCFLSMASHLLWDIAEDALIFGMGINHWKI